MPVCVCACVQGCWSFRKVGCGLLVAMVKEETKGKKLGGGYGGPLG